MTDDTTHFSQKFPSSTQSKTYCFSENDNSQNIVSDDTKIKPHNGFTENKFILHKAKQYRKHNI